MSALPVLLETELRDAFESARNGSEDDPAITGSHELLDHDAELFYQVTYREYHRMGEVEHGVEVVLRLREADDLVDTDISAIEDALTQIMHASLSFDEDVEFDDEGDEYVFIEEIIHSFGERT